MLLFSSCHVHVSLMLTRFCLHKKQVIFGRRSEEHTSELQSQSNLVCRLLLEKNNTSRDRIGVHRLLPRRVRAAASECQSASTAPRWSAWALARGGLRALCRVSDRRHED